LLKIVANRSAWLLIDRERVLELHSRSLGQKTISITPYTNLARRRSPISIDGTQFEGFVEELSACFLRSQVSQIGDEIDRWIRKIVLGLNLDQGALAEIDANSGKLTIRHSWSRERLVKPPIGLELARPAPWFDKMLMAGRTVAFSEVRELPPEFFANDWITVQRYMPKSNVTVPIGIGGKVIGALGFASSKKERAWSLRLIRRLELVGQVFGNAIERRTATAEIGRLRNELSHLSRTATMGELSASLTHQLNQPICAILMNAEEIQRMLESTELDLGNLRAAVGEIIQDDLRATETIKGLRRFFRKSEVEKNPLDLREVVAEVVRMLHSDSVLRNILLSFESPVERMRLVGDRTQLQQVILNLVLNAFDAVSENEDLREVCISMSADKDEVKVAIRDSGKGIDPAAIGQIFQPFFTTKSKGMGLGLTIARSLVGAHGGQISARHNPDRGSTFEIALPALNEII
jgi:signal transduction histidine kinase